MRGWRRVAARAAWVLVVTWIVASFAASLPNQLHTFQHPTTYSTELSPGAVAVLHQVGIPLTAYAWVAVIFGSLIMLAATALAIVLFWRRGDDWMVLLVSLLFPAYCLQSIGPSELFTATPTGSPLAVLNTILLGTVTFAIIYAVFMLFPSGRFAPSWSWALLSACVIWIAARAAKPTLVILFLGYPIFLGAAVACQIYRYRKVSTAVQRQQTLGAVFGLVTALLANQAFFFTCAFTPLGSTIYPSIAYLVVYVSVLLIPVTFFIAIQRNRLYEIDVIIRRTLLYATLTGILARVYAAAIYIAQVVGGRLTGLSTPPPWVIVIATLLVAALFSPLHRWLQVLIDRAFYHTKYNAVRTLAAFGERLRLETDLEELSAHLVDVVQQTMRPTHASLWLHTPRRQGATPATGETHSFGVTLRRLHSVDPSRLRHPWLSRHRTRHVGATAGIERGTSVPDQNAAVQIGLGVAAKSRLSVSRREGFETSAKPYAYRCSTSIVPMSSEEDAATSSATARSCASPSTRRGYPFSNWTMHEEAVDRAFRHVHALQQPVPRVLALFHAGRPPTRVGVHEDAIRCRHVLSSQRAMSVMVSSLV